MRKQTKLVAVLSAAALLAIGASMTSFAATPHWDMEDNEWVYLDRNGDRVTDEWKKSNGQWYYLDENGYMARDMIIEEDDEKYYVDENGARVTNAWVSMDNDDLLDDDNEAESIDTVWMYFDGNGKALGAGSSNGEIKKLSYGDGQSGYFIFNQDGYMLSGWKSWSKAGDKNKLYYLGGQNEGWAAAATWKYLTVDKDWEVFDGVADDDDGEERWFYFESDGKACQNKTKAIGGKTYAFDEFGRMLDMWAGKDSTGTYSNAASSSTAKVAFYQEDNGGREKGWVEVYPSTNYDDYDDDPYWFYLNSKGEPYKANVGVNDKGEEDLTKKDGAAHRVDDTDKSAASDKDDAKYNGIVVVKSIKNESYLFNSHGTMLQGLYWLGGKTEGATTDKVKKGSSELDAGYYYFDEAGGSAAGKMITNKRITIEVDSEDKNYYFNKNGKAYTNSIISGTVYGHNGQMVDGYGDGSTYEAVDLSKIIGEDGTGLKEKDKSNYAVEQNETDDVKVMINGNGKIKKSGTVKDINGDEWNISNYVATKK